MNKPLTLALCVAVASSTAAITHHLSLNTSHHCATTNDEAKYEDDYCVAYWHEGNIVIGPMSGMVKTEGDVIVGSHE